MITEEYARKFQILHEEETGEKISLEEAFDSLDKLVKMVRLIYRPIKKSDFKKFDK